MFDQFSSLPGIVDDRFNFAAMADDAFVFQEPVHVAPGEARDLVKIKTVKCDSKVLAFSQDGPPAQAGLKTFKAQFLKQPMVVADRKTPFRVVIVEKLRRISAPAAARFAIGTSNCRAHGSVMSLCGKWCEESLYQKLQPSIGFGGIE